MGVPVWVNRASSGKLGNFPVTQAESEVTDVSSGSIPMTKLTTICSLSLFTIALSAQGPMGGRWPDRGFGGMNQASRTPVTGAPYSAVRTTQTQRVLQNGNQISRTEQSKVYRDSQGRTRVERTITPPASTGKQPFTEVTIVDPVAGYRYLLNSSNMTAVQMPIPVHSSSTTSGTPPARPSPPNGAQVSTVNLGTQTINSVTATGTQTTETIPAGAIGNAQAITIVRTSWISTDLKVPVGGQIERSAFRFEPIWSSRISRSPHPIHRLYGSPSYTVKTAGAGPRANRLGR